MKSSSSSPPLFPKITISAIISLVLLPLILIVLIGALNFPNEFHLQGLVRLGKSDFAGSPVVDQTTSPPPTFRLLMGVLTFADRYERRHLLRVLRDLQPPTTAQIDLKFVFCNLTRDEQRVLVALEIMRYDDIMILNCWENMNGGKTFAFFSAVARLFADDGGQRRPAYDYVMKTDDDTYFRFPRLVESLKTLPRDDLYWGFVVPPNDRFPLFMAGMGYIVTWDLVEWIATTNVTRNHTIGPEDRMVGEWLNEGRRGKKIFATNSWMYDYPLNNYRFFPDTISVHRLKDQPRWAETLSYFNVTVGLKPSELYHII